jgi:hypothetical protein
LERHPVDKTLFALFVGQHLVGMIHEIKQMDGGGVISASIQYICHGIIVGSPLTFGSWLIEQVSNLQRCCDG